MLKLVKNNLNKTQKILESRAETPKIQITTLPELNNKLWGLHTKKLTIIGARTSQGKSALALQLAWDVARQKIPTMFLSLEMYEEDVIERLFCVAKKVDNYQLLTGKFLLYQKQWLEFQEDLKGVPLVITDMIGRTWEDIDKVLSDMTEKPKVIFIDHLQEARGALLKNNKEVIEEYLKKLRQLAILHDFAVVVCSQVNRSSQEEKGGGGEPQLHHLKSSGYIEEGADVILLLHWEYHYKKSGDKNKFVINVAKNRNGRTGWVNVNYFPEYYLFAEDTRTSNEILMEKSKKG